MGYCDYCGTGKCCQAGMKKEGCNGLEGAANFEPRCVNANNCYQMEILASQKITSGYIFKFKLKCTNDAFLPLQTIESEEITVI
jgi:hypothetical protein